ncbi:alpha/beta fold hydrolase [Pokkaliibacter sp. MBI-7]|uniref:alpha/beta hydrolase n=1 Tax=Pokkaliibacter sp. MBI-7 TaxID=3040600 RepID=UPI00244974D7|nr:alpha/beta fold hydrolase [Pokkaliibacter sp. MBI-7]MDH2432635.1 alpha/beta fold hydrolase [Pokkaliibacter sp. MBI-7]
MTIMAGTPFHLPYGNGRVVGDRLGRVPQVLCLHGAGQSHRGRFHWLREALWQRGIGSLALDMPGHGDSAGVLKQSSLRERTGQALRVLATQPWAAPLTVVGASMSGYTALRLSTAVPVANLVLMVPAAYHRDAYSMRFDQGFTGLIRQPGSWQYSDAWERLQAFRGNLLLLSGQEDEVIPTEVLQRYEQHARQAASVTHLRFACGHQLNGYLAQMPAAAQQVIEQIAGWYS